MGIMKQDLLQKYPGVVLSIQATLRDAMEMITKTQVGIALVVSKDRELLGIVVDSDIRRALLRGDAMDIPITQIMNENPLVADYKLYHEDIAELFRHNRRAYLPLVNDKKCLVGLASMIDYLAPSEQYPNSVVIMAGGQGARLRPLTDSCPKPMMKIGRKPILEHNLEYLSTFGLNRFVLSVNYLEEQIRDYFTDGSKWGIRIEYVSEPQEMGTAGSLSLIENDLGKSFLVMNGDLITKVNFHALLDYHQSERNLATVCLREYDFQVPFGVVQVENHKLAGITEKPVHRFFVNAGIYVLEPEVLQWINKGAPCDMPDLLETIRSKQPGSVGCFPIQEYWLDIGKIEDYQKAVKEFGNT